MPINKLEALREYVYKDTDGLYGDEFKRAISERVAKLPEHRKLAWKVLEFFEQRKGFDWWWKDVDEGIQDEIFTDLQNMLKKETTNDNPTA